MKLLLVENEPDINRLIFYVLSGQGFEVTQAYDASSAEAKLRQGTFDLMLLDLMLPGEDGYFFCRRLKQTEEFKNLPIIIISARVMPDEIKKGMESGAIGYITKPYNPLTLADDIRKLLADYRNKG